MNETDQHILDLATQLVLAVQAAGRGPYVEIDTFDIDKNDPDEASERWRVTVSRER